MALNEYEAFREHYDDYLKKSSAPEYRRLLSAARKEMLAVKSEDKFFFTPRILPEKLIKEHRRRCEKTIDVVNRILAETREGEKTPLTDIIPRKKGYNIPFPDMYEKAVELVDPKYPSIMESRIDGCITEEKELLAYEINANRAGWENSRMFCDIYNKYFGDILPGRTIDFADGWEEIIRHMLKKTGGKKAVYLTEQTGKESIAALKERGVDIEFVRYQDLPALMKTGEMRMDKDEVNYRGERIDLICRFLRTHQVLEQPGLCDCVKAGNVHLINQMDAFYGGIKTLMIRLRDKDMMSPYMDLDELIRLPESWFLKEKEMDSLVKEKDNYVLKFANRGGGKAVYFGRGHTEEEWGKKLADSLEKRSETAMVQEYAQPSLTPVYEGEKVSLMNTTCDVFVFSKEKAESAGVFSRCASHDLVNFKTGGIKQTIFV